MATVLNPWATPSTTNPFSTVSNVKSESVDERLKKLFEGFDQAGTSGTAAIADYGSAVKAATPAVAGQTASDVGALDSLFSGRSASELAGIRGRRKEALGQVVGRSMGDLRRLLGTTQLTMGGGGRGLGTGSFLAKLGLDKAADINARAAVDDAEAERTDWMDLLNRRLAATGQRQRLTDATAARTLLPYQAENERLGAQSNALSNLLQQALANNFFGLRATRDQFAV